MTSALILVWRMYFDMTLARNSMKKRPYWLRWAVPPEIGLEVR